MNQFSVLFSHYVFEFMKEKTSMSAHSTPLQSIQHAKCIVRCHGEHTVNGFVDNRFFCCSFFQCKMEDTAEERQQQPQTEIIESSPVIPAPGSTDETIKTEQPAATSLLQSLLQEQPDETGGKKKKKKKKAKTGRQKEVVSVNFV
jgi:hypothetical protein